MLHKSTKIVAIISFTILVVSISACVAFYFVVSKEKVQFAEHNIERAQSKSHQEALQALDQALSETKEERESLTSRILKDENVIDLLGRIESLGREQGVILTTNSLNVEPLSGVFETLVVNVSVVGPYSSVMQVLKLLEYLPYQSTVRKVQVSGENTGQWNGAFEVRVTKFKKV